jgi:hypothetical protein
MSTTQTSGTAPYKRPGAPKEVVGYRYATPGARYAKQPLKKWQKRELSMRARKAFDKLVKYEAIEQPAGLSVSAWFEQWKHFEQGRALNAAGPVSLNDCKQAHVRDLETWFDSLGGTVTTRTVERAMKSEDVDEGRRQRIQRLQEMVDKFDKELPEGNKMGPNYARTVCRSVFKCDLDDLDPDHFPAVMATVRRRGEAKVAKQKAKQTTNE